MKRPIVNLVTLLVALVASCAAGRGADTINMDVVAHVDPYGDGSMKVTFHLSASQWAIWRQQYGDHPDVLWRDFKQKFAKAALDKFDLTRNDVDHGSHGRESRYRNPQGVQTHLQYSAGICF
jgi:hypothetical protein